MDHPADATGPYESATHDGRNARRDRNREAAIEATVDLLTAGVSQPTAPQVAELAGVSTRSVFRYFEDLDALLVAAIPAYVARHDDATRFVPSPPSLPLADRVDDWMAYRMRACRRFARVMLELERRPSKDGRVQRVLEDFRRASPHDLAIQFAPELAGLDPASRSITIAAMHSSTTVDVWVNLVDGHGLDEAGVAAAFRRMLYGALSLTARY